MAEWIKTRPYVAIVEPDSDPAYEIVKARFVGKPPPLVINAEAGAIINMIRSSLDLLAAALAERSGTISNGTVRIDDVYFPIRPSVQSFDAALKKNSLAYR